jgi:hypothetical protein
MQIRAEIAIRFSGDRLTFTAQWRRQDLAERRAAPQRSAEGKRLGSRHSERQGGDTRKLGEHRSGGAAECEQEPRRLAQAVLSEASFQISGVRSIRA